MLVLIAPVLAGPGGYSPLRHCGLPPEAGYSVALLPGQSGDPGPGRGGGAGEPCQRL